MLGGYMRIIIVFMATFCVFFNAYTMDGCDSGGIGGMVLRNQIFNGNVSMSFSQNVTLEKIVMGANARVEVVVPSNKQVFLKLVEAHKSSEISVISTYFYISDCRIHGKCKAIAADRQGVFVGINKSIVKIDYEKNPIFFVWDSVDSEPESPSGSS